MIDPRAVCEIVKHHAKLIQAHCVTLDIYENNLTPYVENALNQQLSDTAPKIAMSRMVPINILTKVVDKLSNIYQQGVVREVVDGDQSDMDLVSWYSDQFEINNTMHFSNTLFNACKSTLLHPYIHDGKPCLRVIPNDRFIPYSTDPVNPEKPTGIILLAGRKDTRDMYRVYDADSFRVVLSDGTIDYEEMNAIGMEDGINPYGVLPFVYVNSSKLKLCPTPDDDAVRMAVTIPVMLADLNMAAMFQCFSMIYTIDTAVENMPFSPNAVWHLKSDIEGAKPTIGTIKPDVDIQEVMNLVQSEFSLWLGTKGIRSSSVGQLTTDSFASGIAKIIDEMDTLDARQAQTALFSKGEAELWDLVLNSMHPYWVVTKMIENPGLFSPGAKVNTTFRLSLPGSTRTQLIDEQVKEVGAKFTTRRRAIMALNPTLSEMEVDALIAEIDADNMTEDELNQPMQQQPSEDQEDDGEMATEEN